MKIVPNINYKSILSDCKTLKERNEVFNNLDPQYQRLEIAWDALQLLLAGQITAADGCYWSQDMDEFQGDSKELQKAFNTKKFYKENDCQVCQRGALMLSQIRLGNGIDSKDGTRSYGTILNIKGFDIGDFQYMEREYEYSDFKHPYSTNSAEKMANILCNVLVNGNFNKNDKTNYLIIED